MKDLSTEIHNAALADWVKDTWKKDCVETINIWGRIPLWKETWVWSASISFKNGNTSSKQEMEHEDLKILLSQIELFLKTLK